MRWGEVHGSRVRQGVRRLALPHRGRFCYAETVSLKTVGTGTCPNIKHSASWQWPGGAASGFTMKRLATERHLPGPAAPGRVRYKSTRGDFTKERSKFVEFLEHKSLKLTRQRELLLEEIFKDDGHFEAEELVERMKHRDARVSRATVYRTLD